MSFVPNEKVRFIKDEEDDSLQEGEEVKAAPIDWSTESDEGDIDDEVDI